MKIGQNPPLTIHPAKQLRLDGEDLDLYKKALISRNFSHGIGALSYLRRVVENRMNALLELVIEAAASSGAEISARAYAHNSTTSGKVEHLRKRPDLRRTLPDI